jgi:hypothetical protein
VGAPQFPDDPKVHRVLAVYDALQRRDWRALQAEVAPVAVLHLAGASRFAGVYQGVGQIVALAVQFEERIIPFQSDINEITVVDDEVHTVVTVSIRVPPGDLFRAKLVERFVFDATGKVAELHIRAEQQATLDEFLG